MRREPQHIRTSFKPGDCSTTPPSLFEANQSGISGATKNHVNLQVQEAFFPRLPCHERLKTSNFSISCEEFNPNHVHLAQLITSYYPEMVRKGEPRHPQFLAAHPRSGGERMLYRPCTLERAHRSKDLDETFYHLSVALA